MLNPSISLVILLQFISFAYLWNQLSTAVKTVNNSSSIEIMIIIMDRRTIQKWEKNWEIRTWNFRTLATFGVGQAYHVPCKLDNCQLESKTHGQHWNLKRVSHEDKTRVSVAPVRWQEHVKAFSIILKSNNYLELAPGCIIITAKKN